MKYWILGAMSVLIVAVGTTVIPHISINSIRPDIVGSFVVLMSMLSGRQDGVFVAVITGFLEDMVSGQYLGLYTVTRLIIAYISGVTYQKVFQDWVLVPIILVFVMGLAGGCIQVFLLASFGMPFGSFWTVLSTVIFQAMYSALLSPFVMHAIHRSTIWIRRTSESRKSL
ncbi:MAG: rod shape-determining protein MreD [Firmicutes bacterium]|nr:rod shape-determining protein MreD [Bacillota bacterium]